MSVESSLPNDVPRVRFLKDLEVSVGWYWEEWAWGVCREFVSLGSMSVVLGPLHIMLDWSIL